MCVDYTNLSTQAITLTFNVILIMMHTQIVLQSSIKNQVFFTDTYPKNYTII